MDTIGLIKKAVITELSGFSVYFSPSELPQDFTLPKDWSGFGLQHAPSVWLPRNWEQFSSVLPTVHKWLNKCVVGTAIAVSDKLHLVYIYRENNEIGIYLGGEYVVKNALLSSLEPLPFSIKSFYERLHNGFCFYVDRSMGPSPLQDFMDIDELSDGALPTIPGLVGFFSNGAGDYIAVSNHGGSFEFYVWWHEQQGCPESEIDAWAVMDAWMGIFLEKSDSNQDIIG